MSVQWGAMKKVELENQDWPLIWARKFRQALYRQKLVGNGYTPVIKALVSSHFGHPGTVSQQKLGAFIDSYDTDKRGTVIEALYLFYRETVLNSALADFVGKKLFAIKQDSTAAGSVQKTGQADTQAAGRTVKETERADAKVSADKFQRIENGKAASGNRKANSPAKMNTAQEYPSGREKSAAPSDKYLELDRLLEQQLSARNYSKRTITNYRSIIREYLRWLGKEPGGDDSLAIMNYTIYLRDEKGYASRTVNLCCAAIQFFYREVIKVMPDKVKIQTMKTERSLPKVYSEQQIERIIGAAQNPKHQLILMLAYGCGLRLEEVRTLKRTCFDFDKNVLRLRKGKGKKDRIIMLDAFIQQELEKYLKSIGKQEHLFLSEQTNDLLASRTIGKIFDNACKKAGVPKLGGIHTLRHSFATHLHEHGTDIRCIQELLGHATSKTTEIYTHVSTKMIGKIKSPIGYLKLNKAKSIHDATQT